MVDGPAKGKTGRMMWSVEDGRIVCLGEGFGFLRYDRRQFSDFTVRVEYRFSPRQGANSQGNSGIGIRTERFDPNRSRETRPSYAAYEVQLLDDAGSATFGTRDRVTLSVHEPDRQPGAAGSRVEHDRGRVRRSPDLGAAQWANGPGSRPVGTRGRKDPAGRGAGSERQASQGLHRTSEP